MIAVFQFIPVLLFPPDVLLSVNPLLLLAPVALFVFLGWAMLTLKRWALMSCVFVQGFNAIARFLIMFPQAVGQESFDWSFLITSLGAVLLSSLILYLIDKPEVHVAFRA